MMTKTRAKRSSSADVPITPAQAAKTLLQRRAARKHLEAFIPMVFETIDPGKQFIYNWHVGAIAEHLEAVTAREIPRLIINIQPRALKSICVSVAWPMWCLGNNPAYRFIGASYAQSISFKMNMDRRLVTQQPWYRRMFPLVMTVNDQNEKRKFVTTKRGMMMAASVGSAITGDGGDDLVVDDPTDPAQALSEAERNTANTWMDQTFMSRLNDKRNGGVVVIMQRLHSDDMTGHLLEKGGWEHLKIPTVATKKTVIHYHKLELTSTGYEPKKVELVREPGDLLQPVREPANVVERLEADAGPYGWSSQYQQDPVPEGGGIVKADWLRYYTDLPEEYNRKLQSYDTAFKAKESNDYSVGIRAVEVKRHDKHLNETVKDIYVFDVWRQRVEFPELRTKMIELHDQDAPSQILVEDKASGQSVIQELERISHIGPKIRKIKGDTDKVAETHAAVPFIYSGHLLLPSNAPWLSDVVDELTKFPYAKHDDFVVALVQLINYVKEPEPQFIY